MLSWMGKPHIIVFMTDYEVGLTVDGEMAVRDACIRGWENPI
jgi:hypothetical protein